MKTIFFLVAAAVLPFAAFSQCPHSGLTIVTATCDSPRNLQVLGAGCKTLKVGWQGSQEQFYMVTATSIDAINGQPEAALAATYSCDGQGNCVATITAAEGTRVSWTVQGQCSSSGATLNGTPATGPAATVPWCPPVSNDEPNALKVYPNPSSGRLTISYPHDWVPPSRFDVLDMTGKLLLSVSPTHAENIFQLDLPGLITGTYLLKVTTGNDQHVTRFVLLRQ